VAKGLFIQEDGAVIVAYGTRQVAMPRAQYRANGYKPDWETLPPAPKPRERRRRAILSASVGNPAPSPHV
jgi:hypothetical protein